MVMIVFTITNVKRWEIAMSNILNPLEKELLIKLYRKSPGVKLSGFCHANNVSTAAFQSWLKKYDQDGISGLYRSKKTPSILPEGIEENEENLRRELIKTRIELERLKKATPGSRTKMGCRVNSCLYPRRIRNHRGTLKRILSKRTMQPLWGIEKRFL